MLKLLYPFDPIWNETTAKKVLDEFRDIWTYLRSEQLIPNTLFYLSSPQNITFSASGTWINIPNLSEHRAEGFKNFTCYAPSIYIIYYSASLKSESSASNIEFGIAVNDEIDPTSIISISTTSLPTQIVSCSNMFLVRLKYKDVVKAKCKNIDSINTIILRNYTIMATRFIK